MKWKCKIIHENLFEVRGNVIFRGESLNVWEINSIFVFVIGHNQLCWYINLLLIFADLRFSTLYDFKGYLTELAKIGHKLNIADELYEHILTNLYLVPASDNIFISIFSHRELKERKINEQALTSLKELANFDLHDLFDIGDKTIK